MVYVVSVAVLAECAREGQGKKGRSAFFWADEVVGDDGSVRSGGVKEVKKKIGGNGSDEEEEGEEGGGR